MRLIFLVLLFLISKFTTGQELSIVSWNIADFGQTKDEHEIYEIAKLVRNFDIVAIQEVVAVHPGGAKAVVRLADQLNRMGNKWDYRISDPTQSPGKRTERYAFFWKTKKLELVGRPWLDKTFEPIIYREPFLAKFKIENKTILVVNYHSRTYRDRPEEEIVCFNKYPQLFSNEHLIIAGDFNTPSSNSVFSTLRKLGFIFNIEDQKTTLKRKCGIQGVYLNHPIDYILLDSNSFKIMTAGVIDFVNDCNLLTEKRKLSDHLPVWVKIALK